jgi:hypothetical protein
MPPPLERLGVAFSLNLSVARERALLKAAADSNDPVRLFSTYLNRELRKDLGDVPAHGFVFEFSWDGRLHVHGVLVSKEGSRQDSIKKAMMRAGGRISGRAASRQVKLEVLYDGIGWQSYILKDYRSTISQLGTDKIMFISHALGRLARDFHGRKLVL